MPKQYWHTQEILFITEHFGYPYAYMKDVDGCIYIAKAKPIYEPTFDEYGELVSRSIVGYEPELL